MSDIIKEIGSYAITEEDINEFVEQQLPPQQRMYASDPAFRAQIINHLEEMTLYAMYGKELKKNETEYFKRVMMATERAVLGQLAVQDLFGKAEVTEEEAKAFYEANPAQFAADASASASHILVASEEECAAIKAEIEEGNLTFAEAAQKYSTCPSAAQGGDLGTFGPGQMVKEFDEAVFTGELGKVLGPVKTQFGFHLILIGERSDAKTPAFEEIADQVKAAAVKAKQQEVYQEKLAELRASYLK